MTRIKMCGFTREEDIAFANEVMPDYLGFVFWPDSSRYVTPQRALELKGNLDEDITVVGVFVDAPVRFVAALLNEDLIDVAQLHGHEDAAYIESLRATLRNADDKAIMQTFIVRDEGDIQAAKESAADMVLLDAGMGRGNSFDWSLIQDFDRPYFLAGGITPENAAEALARTNAAYLDTSSGIETDGKKDLAKMRAFVETVRAWDDEHPRLSFLEALHPEYHKSDNDPDQTASDILN